jgi:tetratricopeptide (TPR) repeat protein
MSLWVTYIAGETMAANQEKKLIINPVFNRREVEMDENMCFVLMPFSSDLKPIYEDSIRPTVEKVGLKCLRADEIFDVREIMEDVWEYICRARVVVAELTGRNPNVFYELGIAHSLGKEVICIAQTLDDIPFDIRHRRHIIYTYTPRGVKQLEQQLEETIKSVAGRPLTNHIESFVPAIENISNVIESTAKILDSDVSITQVQIEALEAIAWAVNDSAQLMNVAERLKNLGAVERSAVILRKAILKSSDKPTKLIDRLVSLGQISVPYLEEILSKLSYSSSDAWTIIDSLIKFESFDKLIPWLQSACMESNNLGYLRRLTDVGEKSIPGIKQIALFSSSQKNRVEAAKWLASQGEWEIALDVLDELALHAKEGDVSELATEALVSLGKNALPSILRILEQSSDSKIRLIAAESVGLAGDLQTALNVLMQIAGTFKRIENQLRVIQVFGKLGQHELKIEMLKKFILDHEDDNQKYDSNLPNAIRQLGEAGAVQTLKELFKQLQKTEHLVQICEELINLGETQIPSQYLSKKVHQAIAIEPKNKKSNVQVGTYVIRLLAKIGADSLSVLKYIIQHSENFEDLKETAFALYQLGDHENARLTLLKIINQVTEKKEQIKVSSLLKQLGEKDVVRPILITLSGRLSEESIRIEAANQLFDIDNETSLRTWEELATYAVSDKIRESAKAKLQEVGIPNSEQKD